MQCGTILFWWAALQHAFRLWALQRGTTNLRTVTLRQAAKHPTLTTSVEGSYDRLAWESGYSNAQREERGRIVHCPDLPSSLVGTYFRNGPARFRVGSSQVTHPFDGDGMILAATFYGDGRVLIRYRYIMTPEFIAETDAERYLYPNTFGNPQPLWKGKPKNLANTNVIFINDSTLLALWEGGMPYHIHPVTLETIGQANIEGVSSMSAHPRYDDGTWRAFAYDPVPIRGTGVDVFELASDATQALHLRRHNLPGIFGLFHDFVATPNYALFTAAPTSVKMSNAIAVGLGFKPVTAFVGFDDSRPATFYIIPRDHTQRVIEVEVDTHANFHYANAFEDDAGMLVVDTVKAPRLELGVKDGRQPIWRTYNFSELPKTTLWRYCIDPKNGRLIDSYEICDRYLEFPVVDPRFSCRPHRYTWAVTGASATQSAPPQGIIGIDTTGIEAPQVWIPEAYQFAGEPCFVPRVPTAEEGDGYLLTVLFDGQQHQSSLLVFDAKHLAAGPIATLPLGANLCYGLHGTFAPTFVPQPYC